MRRPHAPAPRAAGAATACRPKHGARGAEGRVRSHCRPSTGSSSGGIEKGAEEGEGASAVHCRGGPPAGAQALVDETLQVAPDAVGKTPRARRPKNCPVHGAPVERLAVLQPRAGERLRSSSPLLPPPPPPEGGARSGTGASARTLLPMRRPPAPGGSACLSWSAKSDDAKKGQECASVPLAAADLWQCTFCGSLQDPATFWSLCAPCHERVAAPFAPARLAACECACGLRRHGRGTPHARKAIRGAPGGKKPGAGRPAPAPRQRSRVWNRRMRRAAKLPWRRAARHARGLRQQDGSGGARATAMCRAQSGGRGERRRQRQRSRSPPPPPPPSPSTGRRR